jgi:hypothetical protein
MAQTGWNTHGTWDSLKKIKGIELERGNEWFDDDDYDFKNDIAIWVTHDPKDALFYMFSPEFRDAGPNYIPPDYLKEEWDAYQEALKHPEEHLNKIDLKDAKMVLEDGDGGYLYVKKGKQNPYLSDMSLHYRGRTMTEEPSGEIPERFRLVGKRLPKEMQEAIRELGNEMPIDFVEVENGSEGEPELTIETRCGSSKVIGPADKARLVGEMSMVSCEARKPPTVEKELKEVTSEENK